MCISPGVRGCSYCEIITVLFFETFNLPDHPINLLLDHVTFIYHGTSMCYPWRCALLISSNERMWEAKLWMFKRSWCNIAPCSSCLRQINIFWWCNWTELLIIFITVKMSKKTKAVTGEEWTSEEKMAHKHHQDPREPSLETGSEPQVSHWPTWDVVSCSDRHMHFTLGAPLSVTGLAKLLSWVLDLPQPCAPRRLCKK